MDDTLFFDDWGTGSDLSAGSHLYNLNTSTLEQGAGTGAAGNWSWADLVKGVGTVATEVAKYKAVTLANGSRIYQRIDPATGLPIANTYTATPGSLSAMLSQNMPLLLLGGAVLFFALKGK